MYKALKEFKNIKSDNCITIILNTHRTKPDYLKDSLALKNLVKEAENRLLDELGKRKAAPLIKKLNKLVDEIDHSHNLESLMLFVNEDIADYTRLTLPVSDRVVIDNTFATRDLFRALRMETNYYVLVLSQGSVRLLEVLNDKVVIEFGNPFPMENTAVTNPNRQDLSNAPRLTNLLLDFFNRTDKEINKIHKINPLPVLVVATDENYHHLMKVADKKEVYYDGFLNQNKINAKDFAIAEAAWEVVHELVKKKNDTLKEDLKKAVSNNQFLSDTNDIWRGIHEGRVRTLFIEQGLFQPAVIENDQVVYVPESRRNEPGVIDDIYDEMIEANMDFGGDVVFLPKGELSEFNGLGAITRF